MGEGVVRLLRDGAPVVALGGFVVAQREAHEAEQIEYGKVVG